MKMRFLYTLFFVLVSNVVSGQVAKQMPTEAEWLKYFYFNKVVIEKKLYRFALEGKIKAYKTDSLISVYNPDELKSRGATEKLTQTQTGSGIVDSILYSPFSADNFQNLWFIKVIDSSPFEETETGSLSAIALTFCPYFGGYQAREQPLCMFSIEDLRGALSKSEYEWVKLMYYYTRNDNAILFRDLDYSDSYWDINLIKPAKVWYRCDSAIYKKLSNSLHGSSFYMDDFFYNLKDSMLIEPVLYDYQTKRNISYYDFQVNYKEEKVIFISTNPDDPTVGIDTVILDPYNLNVVKNVNIDKTNSTIKTFNFEFKVSGKSDRIIKFSLDADRIRKRNTMPTIFWFFEDYFRWKK